MTRRFLIGSWLLLCFTAASPADTLLDVFDHSLDSQILSISDADIKSLAEGTATNSDDSKWVKERSSKFILATFKTGDLNRGLRFRVWHPSEYSVGLADPDIFSEIYQDPNFYFFAVDLAELHEKSNAKFRTYDFRNLIGDWRADHNLEKVTGALGNSIKPSRPPMP